MKAVCYHGTNDIRVDRVPDPRILNPRDAIVRVTTTAICGSDLHLYDGFIPTMREGDVCVDKLGKRSLTLSKRSSIHGFSGNASRCISGRTARLVRRRK